MIEHLAFCPTETSAQNKDSGQAGRLFQPLEHHEELHREGPLQDSAAGQLFRAAFHVSDLFRQLPFGQVFTVLSTQVREKASCLAQCFGGLLGRMAMSVSQNASTKRYLT